VKTNDIARLTGKGIVTEDGTLHEVDIIALATGFDSVTGGLKALDVTGLNGEVLAEKWRMGTYTYLGMTVRECLWIALQKSC
jgi:cation diffusion facilitator CzcD-associated flavoprotein CzcO